MDGKFQYLYIDTKARLCTVIFEPTCAFYTVGSYVSLSVCPSIDQKSDWTIIHIHPHGLLQLCIVDEWAVTEWAHCQRQSCIFVNNSLEAISCTFPYGTVSNLCLETSYKQCWYSRRGLH